MFVFRIEGFRVFVCFALLAAACGSAARAQEQTPALGPHALEQLRLVGLEKLGRTPVQKKISSQLLVANKKNDLTSAAIYRQIPSLGLRAAADASGRIEVDIIADISTSLERKVEYLGGKIISKYPEEGHLRAWLPLDGLEPLAELDEVRHIREADQPSFGVVTQGDVAHRANQARLNLGVDGSGVKVGVISDSVEALGNLQAAGELPGVTVLAGQAGSGRSEGTAMLEIIHDLAPGASLYFATANGGEANFAANIRRLRDAGCRVIVDDAYYFAEGVFQDDLIAQAVNEVTAHGVAYFSSAGNSGNLTSGTSGVWEGNFVNGGVFGVFGNIHNFGGSFTANRVTSTASSTMTSLQWSDALGASDNDYDLCAFDPTGNILLGCSNDVQNGDDDPMELLVGSLPEGALVAIFNFAGAQAQRYLRLTVNGARLGIGTTGQTSGHSAAVNAFSVAAVDVATAQGGPFFGGAANPVETFSSDGPRRVFYNANGSAITPGNFLAGGGSLRQKPDLSAADGAASATPGFNPFFGTSAAAPHAAAIGALLLDANPALTLAQLRTALTSTALDIMATGFDPDSGIGIVNALAAVQSVSTGGGGSACVDGPTTLCLLNHRFKVEATYRTASGGTGPGKAVRLTEETGYFWFFNQTNIEAVFKVLNGCGLNSRFWVFAGGLTDVEVTTTVTDTKATGAGAVKTYFNPLGTPFQPIASTSAFATCP